MPQSHEFDELHHAWLQAWPRALKVWSQFVKLSSPRFCFSVEDESREHLSGSFAMIRLDSHAIVVSLRQVRELGLDEFAAEILAHEIGHHVYAPGDLNDSARLLARIRRGLPTQEHAAPMISNLYTDLLINDRLQRNSDLRLDRVFQQLEARHKAELTSKLWTLYLRIYEILWSLPQSTLVRGQWDKSLEVDAALGARLIRAYSGDWLRGGGRFAMLCLTYLLEDAKNAPPKILRPVTPLRGWNDMQKAGAGAIPDGLAEIDENEIDGAIHPSEDPNLSGASANEQAPSDGQSTLGSVAGGGQYREPWEYGEILRASGVQLSDHDLAVRYYRERARPHLIRFPTQESPQSSEPLPEGFESWELGSPLEQIDWLQTAISGPRIVPGLTTMQRTWGEQPGEQPNQIPLDLDLYVDCSGSMPDPQRQTSFPALAGAIVLLSALRAGARVQATLWSGTHDFHTTGEFIRDSDQLLKILTGYIGGATAFPIHLLRQTYENRTARDRPVHILVISDDGVTTMFAQDEKNNSGWDVSRMALAKARGGGTFALNLYRPIDADPDLVRAQSEGWRVHQLAAWDDLLAFARKWSRENYARNNL